MGAPITPARALVLVTRWKRRGAVDERGGKKQSDGDDDNKDFFFLPV
jgi:hypothetical protein